MRLPQPRRSLASLAAAIIVLTNLAAHAQPNLAVPTNRVRVITMDEAIQLALTNDVDILISQKNPLIDQLTLDGYFSAYDPVFGLSAIRSFNSSPGKVDPNTGQSTGTFNSSETAYTPTLTGTLPFGTQYQFSGPLRHDSGSFVSPSALLQRLCRRQPQPAPLAQSLD